MAYNFPDSPSNGDTVTINGIVYTYNSTKGAWKTTAASGGGGGGGASVTSSDTAPTNPSDGDLWWSSSEAVLYIYYADGDSSQWVQASTPGADGASGLNVTTSDTAPTSPSAGDFWWDSDANALFIYYTDVDSSQWVQATTPGADGADGVNGADGVDGADGSAAVYTNATDLPTSNNSTGDLAFVTSTNRLYIWNGSGWYNIALINTTPTISGVSSSYALAIDGTPTVVTITATDPEGLPITYDIVSDTSGNIATVTSNNNVFTITPSTNTADAGSFSLTFRASDGVNIASAISEFTLEFAVQNSNYTTALITSVGTNNAVNNSFVDSSTNSHTITAAGNVTQNTFSPYRHGGYSTYFDGTGDYLNFNGSSISIGTGDFTIEAYVYHTGSSDNTILSTTGCTFTYGVNGQLRFYTGTGSNLTDSGTAFISGRWVHIAAVRTSGVLKMFQDGTEVYSGAYTHNIASFTSALIGRYHASAVAYYEGYITDLRVVVGSALYTSNYTPPTERLTAITNTSLLTCHLPYIADGSTNGHAITVNGNTHTRPFAPYDYQEYTVGDDGGSIYLNGSGDTLTIPGDTSYQFGTGDFTIEFWWHPASAASPQYVLMQNFNNGNNGYSNWLFYVASSNNLVLYSTSTGSSWNVHSALTIGSFTVNQWHHVAITRESGTLKTFMNGNLNSTVANTADYSNTGGFRISSYDGSTSPAQQTNISNLRLVKGTAVYTADFSPPTEPLTAISGTGILLNGTNAGIIDKSQLVKSLTLNGDVKSSTTQTKYLTSSMAFDGTGDYINVNANGIANFGTNDFTIELWAYAISIGNYMYLIEARNSGSQLNAWTLSFNYMGTYNNNILQFASYNGSTATLFLSSNTAFSAGQWTHIAVTRSGTTMKMFLDGTEVASNNSAGFNFALDQNPIHIGSRFSIEQYFNGYMSDIRITKGLARYTANFTPPASELKG